MFTRDDFGRGVPLPLLWVLGPLVLGALVLTAIGIAARATQGFPNIELAEDLRLAGVDGDPLLADATPFTWDRVCVFPSSVTPDEVDALLGFEWGVVGGDPNRLSRPLLVFVEGDRVVTHLFLDRGVIDSPRGDGDCRAPGDESTRL